MHFPVSLRRYIGHCPARLTLSLVNVVVTSHQGLGLFIAKVLRSNLTSMMEVSTTTEAIIGSESQYLRSVVWKILK